MKIKLRTNKQIKKIDYTDKDEFKFDKRLDVVPKKTNRLLCIILTEDKKTSFIWRKYNPLKGKEIDFFRFKKGMYIIEGSGIHITDNNVRVACYLEGISTPIKMDNIEHVDKEVTYIDLQGNERKSVLPVIKGLKFDAKILDTFLNRRFAEIFTRVPVKGFEIYLLLIGIVTIIMVAIGYGVTYAF